MFLFYYYHYYVITFHACAFVQAENKGQRTAWISFLPSVFYGLSCFYRCAANSRLIGLWAVTWFSCHNKKKSHLITKVYHLICLLIWTQEIDQTQVVKLAQQASFTCWATPSLRHTPYPHHTHHNHPTYLCLEHWHRVCMNGQSWWDGVSENNGSFRVSMERTREQDSCQRVKAIAVQLCKPDDLSLISEIYVNMEEKKGGSFTIYSWKITGHGGF